MQCLISQKQRINEVKMFCQIIFPRELVKEPSHPIKLFLCQLLLHKYEVLLQSSDVLKMATNSKIIKYPIPHSQLKNPHKTSSVSLHIFHHYDRDESFVQRHCASVRLIVGVSSTLKVFLGMAAHASRHSSQTFPSRHTHFLRRCFISSLSQEVFKDPTERPSEQAAFMRTVQVAFFFLFPFLVGLSNYMLPCAIHIGITKGLFSS